MSSLLANLVERLSGDSIDPLARSVGAERSGAQAAVATAVPVLLAALARNASRPEGAASLHRALAGRHDGRVLDDLGGFFARPDTKDGDGILRHVLGDRRGAVERGVAKSSGLDPSQVGPLLAALAPVVMGALGRQQRQGGLDTGGLSSMLRDEKEGMSRAAPQLEGLGRLLDRDGDGEIADDLLSGLGGGLLGKVFGGGR